MCEIAGFFNVSLDMAPFDLAILGVFGMMQDSLPQERQLGTTIHASFNELQPIHMPLERTIGEAAYTVTVTSVATLTCSTTRSERSGSIVIVSSLDQEGEGIGKFVLSFILPHCCHHLACGRT
jgi:hypothetical protein